MNEEQPIKGVVVVRGAADGFVQEIVAGAHRFRSDEPTPAGGTDTGPGPLHHCSRKHLHFSDLDERSLFHVDILTL
jgi:hypothetical protein